jgi:sarcosine oxidase gamma subunit
VPAAPNSAQVGAGGVLVARLATAEFLIEACDGGTERVAAARGVLEGAERAADVYPIARQDLVIGISGAASATVLRQICSVDFAPVFERCELDSGQVILTSMIGVGVVAWVRRRQPQPMLTLWIDPSFAHYFWTTLLEVANDLGGALIDNHFRGMTHDAR